MTTMKFWPVLVFTTVWNSVFLTSCNAFSVSTENPSYRLFPRYSPHVPPSDSIPLCSIKRDKHIPFQPQRHQPYLSKQLTATPTTMTTTTTTLFSSVVSTNEELLPGIALIDKYNDDILEKMQLIRQSPYFRLFCVDILASCEYMPQELFECYSETCEVYPVDDEDVPTFLRKTDMEEKDFDLNGWARWDMPSNDYYDTEEFPEGYTGYDGSEIWNYIHRKICFADYNYNDNHWKADFNKAVSGVHAVVSAQVARGIQEKLKTGEEFTADEVWRDPKAEFDRRLSAAGETPGAMENLYFAYMLFLSAASKAQSKIMLDCQSGKMEGSSASIVKDFLSLPLLKDPAIQAVSQKIQSHALESPNNLWEARMRTQDLLRVMNCVQCNKCRLHGKVAMMGLSTALQIHMGNRGEGGDPNRLHRIEVSTLLSTLYKLAMSVDFCKKMR